MRPITFLLALAPLLVACDGAAPVDDAGLATSDGGNANLDAGMTTGSDAGASEDAGSTDTTDAGPPPVPSELVDPNCIDGQFRETLIDPTVDISDLAFSSDRATAYLLEVLSRRYPFGEALAEDGQTTRLGDCIAFFLRRTDSAAAVLSSANTIVHECGHFVDLDARSLSDNTYLLNGSLTLTCSGGDATDRGGNTFARSRIRGDEYQGLVPGDFYADTYLDGDPDDGTFDGGDQGFNMLMEETVQYVNSLITEYALADRLSPRQRVSGRDGILTFLWYVERYLRMARLDFPTAHAFLLGDACWRELVLTVWGRAWLYLEETVDDPRLAIDPGLLDRVLDPELLAEIQRVRDAEGCPAP